MAIKEGRLIIGNSLLGHRDQPVCKDLRREFDNVINESNRLVLTNRVCTLNLAVGPILELGESRNG